MTLRHAVTGVTVPGRPTGMENTLYLRTPALSGLLIAACAVALSTGCGLVDQAKDKADGDGDPKQPTSTGAPEADRGPTAQQPGTTAPTGAAKPSGEPNPAKPAGAVDLTTKNYCNLLTSAELAAVLGAPVERTKNDDTLHTCRYYGPADANLLTVQYFGRSTKIGETPESVVARNDSTKFGQRITDLGDFPTVYIPAGQYPAPGTPEVYFAKVHGEVIVDVHVSLSVGQKALARDKHLAVAKLVAGKL